MTPAGHEESKDYLNALIATFLGWTLDAFDFFVLVFAVPTIAEEFHVDLTEIAKTIAVTLAFRPVGAFIFGLLADRYGRRLPLMLDLVFYSVVEVLSGLAHAYKTFPSFRPLFGIGMCAVRRVGASLVAERLPPQWLGVRSGILRGRSA